MKTKEVVFGGMLAAAGITLLYLGSTTKVVAVGSCVLSGVLTSFPIAYGKRSLSLQIYVVTGVVALFVLPSKAVAALYCLLTGIYPMVKSTAENRFGGLRALAIKLAYWNAFVLLFIVILIKVFLPAISGMYYVVVVDDLPVAVQTIVTAVIINATFFVYDFVLSRCGDVLRDIASRK